MSPRPPPWSASVCKYMFASVMSWSWSCSCHNIYISMRSSRTNINPNCIETNFLVPNSMDSRERERERDENNKYICNTHNKTQSAHLFSLFAHLRTVKTKAIIPFAYCWSWCWLCSYALWIKRAPQFKRRHIFNGIMFAAVLLLLLLLWRLLCDYHHSYWPLWVREAHHHGVRRLP